ncbi:TIGR03087 family PEP-CTERM/XrtA system glycosyltransferase [Aurantiacibacter zhengii]|uniref:TIGR03087 family PEP-CTERM/XrtA system glycosyltransferase n=1 Tax=Aurantiacibacter zhengii TaxID=2307003 RepID=A0A418NVT5_9SPHN|nr:TIGR03087 family PEP-CTERM/XrtA system glycosyltransferase [Aurantiacibacter zhengii]RIV88726.1 TIGR03087 family PEP-CTERM/XrtA system glycosyltransferase [Aurantiacibacter zhengii]
MRGEILFLAHRVPFPPDRGDKIRSHHVLKALAEIAPVHVGCLAENSTDITNEHRLAEVAASWCMSRRSKPLPVAGVEALLRGQPVSLTAFRSEALSQWVNQLLAERDIGAIYVFSGQMGQYVPRDWQGRLLVDLVDVDSAKFEAFAEAGRGPRSWIDAREGKLLRGVEAELAKRADATLLVSEAEADLLRKRVPTPDRIRALRNGIDCAAFDPKAVEPEQALASGGPHYVFTGQMDYAPNIDAVRRMTNAIMPGVLSKLPSAQFHIVGRAPTREVMALDGVNNTRVVGEVPDTRPWLAGADIVVAPLTIARGVQNKVLEAMAMARPVIVSPDAATGIEAKSGRHFIVASNDAAFVEELLRLSNDSGTARALGHSARQFVLDTMSWPAMLSDLPRLLGLEQVAPRDAA